MSAVFVDFVCVRSHVKDVFCDSKVLFYSIQHNFVNCRYFFFVWNTYVIIVKLKAIKHHFHIILVIAILILIGIIGPTSTNKLMNNLIMVAEKIFLSLQIITYYWFWNFNHIKIVSWKLDTRI